VRLGSNERARTDSRDGLGWLVCPFLVTFLGKK
jgi:hypothetical protein